ncbi:MAG: helix-turn-helix domain-containing protein [Dehalococcoidia bacterium]|nr:helix-turn-helix domain-containing protein [Dehalococcoidia bacterium]
MAAAYPVPGMDADPGYLTVAEAAALLGVKAATLYAYVSRGRVRSYRRGVHRHRYYRRDDIEALLRLRDSADTPIEPADVWARER